MSLNERFDVVVYEIATRKIDHIAGKNLLSEDSPNHGLYTLEKRLETVTERLNPYYDAIEVPTGKYAKGDILEENA